jgi:cellobiose-specific phosphotransferase system component IIC
MSKRLPPQSIRLTGYHEWWAYAVVTLLVSSGSLWLLFHYFVMVQSDFGAIRHPLEVWWLKVHGAAAMLTLVLIGTMMPVHIRKAWHAGKNRWTGAVMLAVLAVLILTAYALYYYTGEASRPWVSAIHWVIGLGMVPAIILHVVVGRLKHARRPRAVRHSLRSPGAAERPFTPRLVSVATPKSAEESAIGDGKAIAGEG